MSLVPYSSQLLQARRCMCKYYIEGFQIMKIGMFKRLKYCKQAYVYLWKHACIFSFKRRKISIDPKLMESILFLKAGFFCGTGPLEHRPLAFKDRTGSLLLQKKNPVDIKHSV
jgi:hypothetical protein